MNKYPKLRRKRREQECKSGELLYYRLASLFLPISLVAVGYQ